MQQGRLSWSNRRGLSELPLKSRDASLGSDGVFGVETPRFREFRTSWNFYGIKMWLASSQVFVVTLL